jgi:hypothetical protein
MRSRETAMATITNADLHIHRDEQRKVAIPEVICNVNFNAHELKIIKALPGTRVFRLKCELWGGDSGSSDDFLFRYAERKYFGDSTPTANELRRFVVEIGQDILNEDTETWWGGGDDKDDIYGLLVLDNVLIPGSPTEVARAKTPERHGYF